jgi:hypothetical protein
MKPSTAINWVLAGFSKLSQVSQVKNQDESNETKNS